MIREARSSDADAVVRMMRAFHGMASPPFAFSEAHVRARLDAMMYSPDALVLILDCDGEARGVLAAFAVDHPFAPVLVAHEMAWWVDEDVRSLTAARSMIVAYEAWARSRGCAVVGMSALSAGDPIVASLIERHGFKPMETNFAKVVA